MRLIIIVQIWDVKGLICEPSDDKYHQTLMFDSFGVFRNDLNRFLDLDLKTLLLIPR